MFCFHKCILTLYLYNIHFSQYSKGVSNFKDTLHINNIYDQIHKQNTDQGGKVHCISVFGCRKRDRANTTHIMYKLKLI